MNCILTGPSPATIVLQWMPKTVINTNNYREKGLKINQVNSRTDWDVWISDQNVEVQHVSPVGRLLKVCSCYQVRTKVTVLKRSLSVLSTHCLVVSSWRCSRSFGLEDKDNLWNSCLKFCLWLRRSSFKSSLNKNPKLNNTTETI